MKQMEGMEGMGGAGGMPDYGDDDDDDDDDDIEDLPGSFSWRALLYSFWPLRRVYFVLTPGPSYFQSWKITNRKLALHWVGMNSDVVDIT
jgi:hypothetical protein